MQSPVPITQSEIDILFAMEDLIRQRWRIYDKVARGVLSRLLAGAKVESGPRTAGIRRVKVGGQDGSWLLIDGRRCLPAMGLILGPRRKAPRDR